MNTISMELHQEQITELQSQFEESESKNHCLEEELEDLKAECEDLEDRCESYKKASQTVLSIYNEDLKKMDDLQEFNNKLIKSCKKANRDFFILAAAYVATLMLMIYLFIRQGGSDIDVFIAGIRKCILCVCYSHADYWYSYCNISDCYCSVRYCVGRCEWHRRR